MERPAQGLFRHCKLRDLWRRLGHKIGQLDLLRQPDVEKAQWTSFHRLRQHAAFAVGNISFEFFFIGHDLILFACEGFLVEKSVYFRYKIE